jgi:hypothetical protein
MDKASGAFGVPASGSTVAGATESTVRMKVSFIRSGCPLCFQDRRVHIGLGRLGAGLVTVAAN